VEGSDFAGIGTSALQGAIDAIVASSGVMLTFIWGLIALRNQSVPGLQEIRWASLMLVLAIFFGLLTLQFAITKTKNKVNPVSSDLVAFSFGVTWILFLAGGMLVALAVFSSSPTP